MRLRSDAMGFPRRSAFEPVGLGSVGTVQLPDTSYSMDHGRDLIASMDHARQRAGDEERCAAAGLGLARILRFGDEDLDDDPSFIEVGQAMVEFFQGRVGESIALGGSFGFAFGCDWPKPAPAGDNAALFAALLAPPADLPGGLQALCGFALRAGVIVARDTTAVHVIAAEDRWEEAQGVSGAAYAAMREGVQAGWQQVVARAR